MAETWPVAVNTDIITNGFSQKARENTIRSKVEAGLDKLRNRYTTPIVDSSVNLVVTFAEYTALEAFYNTTLQGGVLTFNFTDPADSTEYEYRFLETIGYSPFNTFNYLASMKWERV